MNILRYTMGALFMCLSTASNAFTFDEATQVDIYYSTSGSGFLNFDFDAGLNTISATQFHNSIFDDAGNLTKTVADFDIFNFTIAQGMFLNSISISYTNISTSHTGIVAAGVGYAINNSAANSLAFKNVNVLDPANQALSLFDSLTPLSAGNYRWDNNFIYTQANFMPGNNLTVWDYTLSFDVRSVSEPSSLLLFSLGLIGLLIGVRSRTH